ncbi:type II toxin-antitoxin system VapB family antitoxin [Desulfomarina sp.]
MRTNIVLDDALVAEALRLSGLKTKREVVDAALRDFVERKKRKNLLELAGQIQFRDGYDYKTLRLGK